MTTYAEALAVLRASKIPWPTTMLRLRFGLKPDQTCGACDHFLYQNNCGQAWTTEGIPSDTIACGKFRVRKERGD